VQRPRVRDILIEKSDKYPFREFSEMYAGDVTVNWRHGAMAAVMLRSETSNELVMNPLFVGHARKLENWSVGDAFKKQFPELANFMDASKN
jgi:hypothetical protein